MFSVTSETAANLSLQNAPSRPAKADQSPAPDSFSALVDGNAADGSGNDRAAPAAPDRPSQRPDEPSTTSDGRPPRDAASSSNAAKAPSQNDGPSAAQPAATGAEAGAISKPAKPELAKTGIVKTAVKDAASDIVATTDSTASADPAASAQAAATGATPAAVAAVIAVPVAATDIVAAPASPPSTTEPLAIAAAAIATSTSTVEASKAVTAAVQGLDDQAKPAPAPATQAVAPSEATPIAATPLATTPDVAAPAVAVSAQASATDAIAPPVNQPAAKADAVVQANPELAAAVAAATPAVTVAPKATPRTTIAARPGESAASIKTGLQPGAGDASAPTSSDAASKGVAPQGPDAKPKTDGGAVNTAKTDPANTDAPAPAAATAHEHRAVAAQVQTDAPDVNQAANAVQQPQAPSAMTPIAAQLTVTAATAAAVPLNGLALQIAVSAQSGNSRFEIRLDPAELGRIDVRIDVDRHGQLTSHLTVEKPETLAMLRQDAPQLQRALDNAGFKTGDGGLQFSLRDQSSSGQNAGDGADRNAQRLIISEDDGITASVAGRTYGRMSGSGGGVDIRV
ncbi:MAG: flagellar hook-length control protein FliK [Bradyrhizobium sp.]|nr:flagellar hook-length control protein FliK [Bradyrhizobium sp.]